MASAARLANPTEHPHVVRTPGVCGGRPHLKGSRIPVSAIAELFRRGEPAHEIAATYSHLDPAAVYDAISYYLDHRGQIEADRLEAAVESTGARLDDDGVIRFLSPDREP